MKQLNKEALKEATTKLMFQLNDDELDALVKEFDVIIKEMELIGEIPGINDVEPMTFPFDCSVTYLREDVASAPIDRDELLKNAKDVVDGQIRLPKVIK